MKRRNFLKQIPVAIAGLITWPVLSKLAKPVPAMTIVNELPSNDGNFPSAFTFINMPIEAEQDGKAYCYRYTIETSPEVEANNPIFMTGSIIESDPPTLTFNKTPDTAVAEEPGGIHLELHNYQ